MEVKRKKKKELLWFCSHPRDTLTIWRGEERGRRDWRTDTWGTVNGEERDKAVEGEEMRRWVKEDKDEENIKIREGWRRKDGREDTKTGCVINGEHQWRLQQDRALLPTSAQTRWIMQAPGCQFTHAHSCRCTHSCAHRRGEVRLCCTRGEPAVLFS